MSKDKTYQQNTWSRNSGKLTSLSNNTNNNNNGIHINGSSNHLHMQRSGSGYSCSYLGKKQKQTRNGYKVISFRIDFCVVSLHIPCVFCIRQDESLALWLGDGLRFWVFGDLLGWLFFEGFDLEPWFKCLKTIPGNTNENDIFSWSSEDNLTISLVCRQKTNLRYPWFVLKPLSSPKVISCMY